MTLRQTACPSTAPHKEPPENPIDRKQAAFLNIQEYKRLHPFPKGIDWEKEREEALAEKYGYIV